MEHILNFYSCYLATLIYRVAFNPELNFKLFFNAMPFTADLISVEVAADRSSVVIKCNSEFTITIERSTDKQRALVKCQNDIIKLYADDNDNYELECFILNVGILNALSEQTVITFLKNWYESRHAEMTMSDLPYSKFAVSVLSSVQDIVEAEEYE